MGADSATVARTNWAGNVTFGARAFHAPASIAQLQTLVAGCDLVRTLGTGHSFNRLADTAGDLVTTARLPKIIELDPLMAQVSVSAGVRYGELAPLLNEAGFALRNLGSLPHISVAGACTTGTHGSGDANGNLATHVSALEVVTAAGDLVRVSRDQDRFPAMVVSLGCLGVLTRLTLDLVRSYDVRQYVYEDLPDDALDQDLLEILTGGYSVSVFTDLRTHRVWRKCLVDEPVRGGCWFGASPATTAVHPVRGVSAEHCTQQGGVAGPWHQRLPHFRLESTPSVGAELQSEYLLPRHHAADALRAIRGLREHLAPVLQIAEIRCVAADDLWLSPSYQRDTVSFHFTWTSDESAVLSVLPAVEERLADFDPRPHWAKLFTTAPAAVRAQYERLSDFASLVREYDPTGKFGNDLTDRYLG